jgi:hypothetical protein
MALAVVGLAGPASAYTLDTVTGLGWVGKGEVQTAFAWNNQAMQRNVGGVTFSYESSDTYSAVCSFTTGAGTPGEQTHDVTIPRHTSVSAVIAYDQRNNSKGINGPFTGWYLTGFGATSTTGTVPVVGEACVANEAGIARNGVWTSVTLTSSAGGGLYAVYDGVAKLLTVTPVI